MLNIKVASIMSMMGNYEERKVGHYKKNGVFVSTCLVTDSDQPYETAVAHRRYNNGNMMIVEMYKTVEDAKAGHKKWVKTMTGKRLPKTIFDRSTSDIAKLMDDVTKEPWREKQRTLNPNSERTKT